MMLRRLLQALVFLGCAASAHAGDSKADAPSTAVPYRLTDTQHVLVRVKINDKGPFNFIVDTGCPVLIVATPVAKKIGLQAEKGWAVLDKLELEGGLSQSKVKARVETPFQLEGMNGMGLAGVELHGLLGYSVIAKYKMEFDFTRDQLRWKPLAYDPPEPRPIGVKGGAGGLEMIAGLMKFLTVLSGLKPAPPPVPRGFLGFQMSQANDGVAVSAVLAKSPAAEAGLRKGDRLLEIDGATITSIADVQRATARLVAGTELRLRIQRGTEKQELKITAGHGL
ncbi:MAG: PDZ domain-containing protein [Gemmataceae bacterium]|nr:PDZ domain-containing protein [Gemmataceae bacterium]